MLENSPHENVSQQRLKVFHLEHSRVELTVVDERSQKLVFLTILRNFNLHRGTMNIMNILCVQRRYPVDF